ncbi:MAG: acyl-CoA thioesterase [Bacteroidia bacterium]|nr:acyl-CoA thioesterase [Nitrosopumilus sp.]
MITSQTKLRVRYAETDKMGYVYYGDYAQYFEVGRVEALRELGWSYRAMEDNGIMLPVMEFTVRYLKPAYYDDLLTIKTYIKEAPTARIKFYHEIYNEKGEKLTMGEVTLVFINMKTNKPCAAPDEMVKAVTGN